MLSCPHCKISIWIESVNCGIFRCGVYKHTHQQIDPHLSQAECERVKEEDLIYGCGHPFEWVQGELVPCDYI
jgi:hypothetical protein